MKKILTILLLCFGAMLQAQETAVTQKMPHFPGGDDAFYSYLDKNVTVPHDFDKEAYKAEHHNQFVPVSVGFTIDVDGTVTNVKVIEGQDAMLDKRAKEIVEKMPKWEPGKSAEGKPIKVDFAIPIRFNLM
ncbi:MAG: energy transducer TonB [Flavobacteriales bacterium]|nr:energy transducer TonB [Flavobacteriales bacterium]